MKTLFIILLILPAIIACDSFRQKDKPIANTNPELITKSNLEQAALKSNNDGLIVIDNRPKTPDDSLILNGVLGLLVCENVYDSIIIYNSDSSIFTQVSFKGDDSKEFFEKLNQKVNQFNLDSYHPEYSLLIFPSSPKETWYEIYLKDGIPKYVQKNSKIFKFYTWQEYLLSNTYLSIDDDILRNTNNPFRESNDSISRIVDFKRKKDEIYFINSISIDGDWLKVVCEYENNDKKYAWVKWRYKDKFLLKYNHIL
jgi:hypothetical protein